MLYVQQPTANQHVELEDNSIICSDSYSLFKSVREWKLTCIRPEMLRAIWATICSWTNFGLAAFPLHHEHWGEDSGKLHTPLNPGKFLSANKSQTGLSQTFPNMSLAVDSDMFVLYMSRCLPLWRDTITCRHYEDSILPQLKAGLTFQNVNLKILLMEVLCLRVGFPWDSNHSSSVNIPHART